MEIHLDLFDFIAMGLAPFIVVAAILFKPKYPAFMAVTLIILVFGNALLKEKARIESSTPSSQAEHQK